MRAAAFSIALLTATVLVQAQGRGGQPVPSGPQPTRAVPAPHFEYAGPVSAGRISAAAAVAGKPGVYYAGAASGGVWKSIDGGTTWKPTFDNESSQAIGALAVSQSNPNTVWAGTGEGWAVRDMDMMGDGIYKSTDAGDTWTNAGLRDTGRIGTIAVHPTNDNVVLVCALGRATGPQHERGVYRTEDGGKTWQQVLFVDENTGCSGLQISQKDPNIVLVGTWQMYLQTHVLESGGPGSGIYLSHDGGKTFTKITDPGLPKSPYGKTDVAIAPSDPNRMYALIQTGADGVQTWGSTTRSKSEAQGSLWRSDDDGKTWKNESWDRRLIGRAGYYIRVRVSPDNPDHLLITNSSLWESNDGGKVFHNAQGCGDCHDIWWDTTPSMPGHYIVTGDGAMSIFGSPANPNGATSVSLPIGQMYRVTVDQRYPYWLYSDRQDDGSMRFSSARPIVPANVPSYAPAASPEATAGGRGGRGGRGGGRGGRGAAADAEGPAQENMPSCESGYTYPEPNNSRFVWGTCYAAHVATYDELTGLRRSVSPWMHTLDSDPVGLKYRCQWSPPLAIDWFDNSVYFGCNVLFRTRDRGQTWQVISPDLSTQDPTRIRFSGGVVGDNLGQFYGALISAITPSRTQKGVVWVGTNDGKVWISRDAGVKWTDLTANLKMPKWGIVRRIDSSYFDPGTAYIAIDYHLVDVRDPFLAKTTDFGQTWTRLDATLPKGHPLDYTLTIAEDPHRKGMIFAGTGHAFFYSRDDGKTWTQFKDKLPAAPVNWIEIPKNAPELAVATYGRGIWILRDVEQLENADLGDPAADLHLYKPIPATRTAEGGQANFVFDLKSAPSSPITVEILDSTGAVVDTSKVTGHAGLNEASWNLLYPPPDRVVLRSIPPDDPHIWDEGRFQNRERPLEHWGLGAINWRPRALPGKYTVRLTLNGKPYSQPFEVWRDVTMPATEADLAESFGLQRRIISAMNDVADKINRIEIMRMQIEDLRKANGSNAELDAALAGIAKQMYDTELSFLSKTEMHSDDKWYVEKYHVYFNLIWLLAEVGGGGGDVMGGAGYRPTQAASGVYEEQLKAVQMGRGAFATLMAEVDAFNKAHVGKLPAISDQLPAGRRQ